MWTSHHSPARFDSRAALTIFPLVMSPTFQKYEKKQSAKATAVRSTEIKLVRGNK